MESAVKALVSKRYPVTTLNLSYENGKKCVWFKFKNWQNATVDDCLDNFVDFRHNAVAIITNDVLVIDGDVLKQKEIQDGEIEDGMIFLSALIEEHGLPEKTPRARTPSGGKHVFFDLAKSLEQGLLSAQNRQKITINEAKKQASLDVRGIGGCILVSPSSYKVAGETRKYEFEVDLCDRNDLPAAPSWLIDLLNENTKRQGFVSAVASRTRMTVSVPMTEPGPFNAVKSILEYALKNKVDKVWVKEYGFDFSVVHKTVPCLCCNNTHTSNNYQCREVLSPCFTVRNYSSRCRPQLVGLSEHVIIKQVLESPKGDDCYVNLLKSKYELEGKQLKASGDANKPSFFLFDGNIWSELKDIDVRQAVRAFGQDVVDKLLACFGSARFEAEAKSEATDKIDAQLHSLCKAKQQLQKSANTNSICASGKEILWDKEFAKKLDQNPDFLAVKKGVIDLVRGETISLCCIE